MHRLRQLIYFVRLGRPLFLAGGFVFNGLGISVALFQGYSFSWPAAILGQLAITSTQLMTHYSNDYFDLQADRANKTATRWSGGSRILAEDLLPPQVALYTALFFGLLALLTSIVLGLFVQPAPLTVPLLLLAIFLGWEYSAPPLNLHSRGAGELTVALLIPVLTPLVGYYLQSGALAWLPLLAGWPLACFQAAMIMVINFPDAAGDRQANKDTLVIRLGPEAAVRLYLILLAVAYFSIPLMVLAGFPLLPALALLIPLPIALWLGWRMKKGDWAKPTSWNILGFWSIGLLISSAGLELAAFLWLALS